MTKKCQKFKDGDQWVCDKCGACWGKGTPVEETWRPSKCTEGRKK